MEPTEPQQNEEELFKARIASAEGIIKQAEVELENAQTDADRVIWSNRLQQRKQSLEKIREEQRAKENVAA